MIAEGPVDGVSHFRTAIINVMMLDPRLIMPDAVNQSPETHVEPIGGAEPP